MFLIGNFPVSKGFLNQGSGSLRSPILGSIALTSSLYIKVAQAPFSWLGLDCSVTDRNRQWDKTPLVGNSGLMGGIQRIMRVRVFCIASLSFSAKALHITSLIPNSPSRLGNCCLDAMPCKK